MQFNEHGCTNIWRHRLKYKHWNEVIGYYAWHSERSSPPNTIHCPMVGFSRASRLRVSVGISD